MRNIVHAGLASLADPRALPRRRVYAQKGVGDTTGIASRAVKPEIVTLSGKMVEVRTGLCESSTGRSPVGTHIILETSKGKKLNVHLGPASAVADMVAKLNVGDELAVKAFRTEKMKSGDYVAQEITAGRQPGRISRCRVSVPSGQGRASARARANELLPAAAADAAAAAAWAGDARPWVADPGSRRHGLARWKVGWPSREVRRLFRDAWTG